MEDDWLLCVTTILIFFFPMQFPMTHWNMTTYGTIPAGTPASSSLGCTLFARERFRLSLGTRRPWKEMVQLWSLSISANATGAFQKTQNPRCLLLNKLHHCHSLHLLRHSIHSDQALAHAGHGKRWSSSGHSPFRLTLLKHSRKSRTHATYFRINYIIVILFILFAAVSIPIPKSFTIYSA